jgi:hypothetical protein
VPKAICHTGPVRSQNRSPGAALEATRSSCAPDLLGQSANRLAPTFLALQQVRAGFHCFRRFRESVLQMSDARNLLVDYWMGHENREMGTRYAKQLFENIQWRKEWTEKVGLGFKLPTLESSVGLLGLPKQRKSKLEKVA